MLFGRQSSAVDWLIVGLGNPGSKYENTRHNMGFKTIDLLAEKLNVPVNKVKFKAVYNTVNFAGCKCLIMKPQTYMNLSGEAVREAAQFYKIPADQDWRGRSRGCGQGHGGLGDRCALSGGAENSGRIL